MKSKYHTRSVYERLYSQLMLAGGKDEPDVMDLTLRELLASINVALQFHNCVPFTQWEVLRILAKNNKSV